MFATTIRVVEPAISLDERSATVVAYACKCCGDSSPPASLTAREMMYGTRQVFVYRICAACESLQIADIPDDLSLHYRSTYPSWPAIPSYVRARHGFLQRRVRRWRTQHALGRHNPIGAWMTAWYGPPEFPFDWAWIRATNTSVDDVVLDYGCGTGSLLYRLRVNGFTRLFGYDKYAPEACSDPDLRISDRVPTDLVGRCDLVMSHHALEHMPDPLATLHELSTFLAPDGALLVRIPIASSYAARHYGPDWVQLDAPRHLVIPSERGLRSMATRAGLDVVDVWYDSTAFQFVGSEQYRRDIPMYDEERSWLLGRPSTISAEVRAGFATRSARLNDEGLGDQACFILRCAGLSSAAAGDAWPDGAS